MVFSWCFWVTGVSEVDGWFKQLPNDVYEVFGSLVWTEMLSISKFDAYLLWKQNFGEKRELCENKCYNCFGVIRNELETSIYRHKSEFNVSFEIF